MIGTHLHSFKEYLAIDVRNDEEFYVGVVSTFIARFTSMTNEMRKKQYIPSNYTIKQIQVGWKGRINIWRFLSERWCSPLEDKKCATFFKITDAIAKLDNPPIIRNSTLVTVMT